MPFVLSTVFMFGIRQENAYCHRWDTINEETNDIEEAKLLGKKYTLENHHLLGSSLALYATVMLLRVSFSNLLENWEH